MTTASKILATVSVTGLVGGSIIDYYRIPTNPAANPALAALLPLGAIAFGLFLIVFMMEKEVAKYDEEEARKLQLRHRDALKPASPQKSADRPISMQLKEKVL